MKHYVYIIYSKRLDIFYKGYSLNPKNRLLEHNSNFSAFTAHKGPWEIVYLEIFMIKSKALNREKSLKKYDHQQLLKLINSNVNQLNFYLDSCL
ncbi:MAG: GIY-YIG nuclease family protein [Saprospiraceae bacterium]|nr:GIY-YIG nuclease family protein [Candidatus Vicinibacter affinis]